MSFLQTLSANDLVSQYVAAYNAIDSHTRAIEAAAPPGDYPLYPNWQKAQAALSQGKQAALDWPNRTAAQTKETPTSIVNWDPELAALIANLKQQAKTPISEAAKKLIAVDAQQIVKILGQKAKQFSALVTGLSSLADDLAKADVEIGGRRQDIYTDIRNYQQTRAELQGLIQAEQSKVCPSRSTMADLVGKIEAVEKSSGAAKGWYNTLGAVLDKATEAVPSARFLRGFWQEIGKGVAQAIAAANRLPQDPEAALSLDLEYIQKSWTKVRQEMLEITQQLP